MFNRFLKASSVTLSPSNPLRPVGVAATATRSTQHVQQVLSKPAGSSTPVQPAAKRFYHTKKPGPDFFVCSPAGETDKQKLSNIRDMLSTMQNQGLFRYPLPRDIQDQLFSHVNEHTKEKERTAAIKKLESEIEQLLILRNGALCDYKTTLQQHNTSTHPSPNDAAGLRESLNKLTAVAKHVEEKFAALEALNETNSTSVNEIRNDGVTFKR